VFGTGRSVYGIHLMRTPAGPMAGARPKKPGMGRSCCFASFRVQHGKLFSPKRDRRKKKRASLATEYAATRRCARPRDPGGVEQLEATREAVSRGADPREQHA